MLRSVLADEAREIQNLVEDIHNKLISRQPRDMRLRSNPISLMERTRDLAKRHELLFGDRGGSLFNNRESTPQRRVPISEGSQIVRISPSVFKHKKLSVHRKHPPQESPTKLFTVGSTLRQAATPTTPLRYAPKLYEKRIVSPQLKQFLEPATGPSLVESSMQSAVVAEVSIVQNMKLSDSAAEKEKLPPVVLNDNTTSTESRAAPEEIAAVDKTPEVLQMMKTSAVENPKQPIALPISPPGESSSLVVSPAKDFGKNITTSEEDGKPKTELRDETEILATEESSLFVETFASASTEDLSTDAVKKLPRPLSIISSEQLKIQKKNPSPIDSPASPVAVTDWEAEAQRLIAAGKYKARTDKSTGRVYYVDRTTKKTCWNLASKLAEQAGEKKKKPHSKDSKISKSSQQPFATMRTDITESDVQEEVARLLADGIWVKKVCLTHLCNKINWHNTITEH